MLNRLTRSLHFQNLARFSKKKKKNEFVFKAVSKPQETGTKISQSTQTESPAPEPPTDSIKQPIQSDLERRHEIIKKIQSTNEMARKYEITHVIDWLKHGAKVEDFACEKKRNYPYHIDHWNPESPGYVAAERDEDRMRRSVDGYNEMVDQLRTEIEVQKVYQSKLEKMERKYLQGVPGIQ